MKTDNFVENIFGNGGDPNLPENDAGLDSEHWSGHTGCVVLAPHLGSATRETRTAMAELAVANVLAVLHGRPALTPVTPK